MTAVSSARSGWDHGASGADERGSGNRADLLSPHWKEWAEAGVRRMPAGWDQLGERLGDLQDAVAGAVPPENVVAEASALIARATDLLRPHEVPESEQLFGRLLTLASRGQTFSPPLWIDDYVDGVVTASTRFGRFHSGNNGVVHGGAIALMFDDALGRTADIVGGGRSRTASLTVDYRSLTPLERPLDVSVQTVEHNGRKRVLHGTLSDDGRLCAEATGLFLEMRPDQP